MKKLVPLMLLSLLTIYLIAAFPIVYPVHLRWRSMPAGSTGNPSNAPTISRIASTITYVFAKVSAGSEEVGIEWAFGEDCEVSGQAQYLQVFWAEENGDPIQTGETVVLTFCYRTQTGPGDTLNSGTEQCQSVTYTEAGTGASYEIHSDLIPIPWSTGNQPLSGHVGLTGYFVYGAASTYTGDIYVGGYSQGAYVNSLCTLF